MCERRGYAILIQGGDPVISSTLGDVLKARLPEPKPLTEAQKRGGSTEMDRGAIQRRLSREMHKEPVDYLQKIVDAELVHGESLYEPGPLRKLADRLLVAYAMAYLRIRDYFDWERAQWRE